MIIGDEKLCPKCNEWKPLSLYSMNKNAKDGLQSICKECQAKYRKKNRKKINKNHQRYYQEHKEEIIKKQKQYYYDNRENELQKRKQYQIDYADHIAEIKKQYYEENKEKIAQKNKEYYENNREHKILVQHEYYNIHRDKLLEQKHQYYIDHKDEIITKNQIRRSMVNNAEGEFTKEQVSECINFFDGVCAYSGDVFSEDDRFKCLSLDHIVAITNGGVNYIWNIVPTTFSHNSSKGTKDMIEWYSKQPFYSDERLSKILAWKEYAYNKWGKELYIY